MRIRAVAAVVLTAGLAACSAPVAGTPTLSPRPRDIRIDGVDPCSLLTPAQRVQLGLDRPPQFLPGDATGDRALCTWRGDEPRAVDTGVSLHTTRGIEIYDTTSGSTTWNRTAVRDYPALLLTLNGRPEFCTIAIDIAQGQAIDVQFGDGGRKPAIPQAQLCADARRVADLVMGNLLGQL